MDWEFPGQEADPDPDKRNFVLFLKDARNLFKNESRSTNQTRLSLSVAVAATETIIQHSYNASEMARYVDFLNLMSYDYHMFDEVPPFPFTGHNSPLFSRKIESAYFATLNMAWSAEHWVELGVHREKIMVGIPTYARTYTLARADLHGLDAPATGSGPGPQGSVDYPWGPLMDWCK